MKIRFFFGALVLALLSATSVKAQDERGIFVEGVASYASTHYKNYAVLTPAVGYQFNDRWAAGFKVGFDTGDLAYVTYTPFARFSFLTGSAFRMFVEGKLNFASSDVDGGQCTYQEKKVLGWESTRTSAWMPMCAASSWDCSSSSDGFGSCLPAFLK